MISTLLCYYEHKPCSCSHSKVKGLLKLIIALRAFSQASSLTFFLHKIFFYNKFDKKRVVANPLWVVVGFCAVLIFFYLAYIHAQTCKPVKCISNIKCVWFPYATFWFTTSLIKSRQTTYFHLWVKHRSDITTWLCKTVILSFQKVNFVKHL